MTYIIAYVKTHTKKNKIHNPLCHISAINQEGHVKWSCRAKTCHVNYCLVTFVYPTFKDTDYRMHPSSDNGLVPNRSQTMIWAHSNVLFFLVLAHVMAWRWIHDTLRICFSTDHPKKRNVNYASYVTAYPIILSNAACNYINQEPLMQYLVGQCGGRR